MPSNTILQEDLQNACGRILHMTPSRFTRTNQSRTWNTGNGSPDAISFQVDRPGTTIVGVGIFGGVGHYEYELELLEDVIFDCTLQIIILIFVFIANHSGWSR